MNAPLRPLSEIATIQTGIPFLASADMDGGEPVFMPAAIRGDDEMLPDDSMVQAAKLLVNPEKKYRLQPQDILITAKATPGTLRCGYLSAEWSRSWLFGANLIQVHAHAGKIHPRFLHAWLCHPEGRAALIGGSQSTTGQLNLTAGALANVKIPVPSWQEQMRAVELIELSAIAHRNAIAAAESRLILAREIAFNH
jgi:type I restriction enzyme S subunit